MPEKKLVEMQFDYQVSSRATLQIPPQPVLRNPHQILLDTDQPILFQAIIDPKWGMEGPFQTPQPPKTCSSPGPGGKSCWNLDVRVAMLLLSLAGLVILLLLYRLLQLRHRLRLSRARHAMEYCSFFHSAAYTLKHPAVSQDLQVKNGKIPEATPPVQNAQEVTTSAINSLPSPPQMPLPSAPVLPPPPLYPPPSLPPTPPVPAHPLSLPVIQTEPPSPHLSWGACSDGDVYSRIGAFRPSRLSSLSNHSKVILFEHSSL